MNPDTPVRKKSASAPGDLVAQAEEQTGVRGRSAYVARGLATQSDLDRLDDYLAVADLVNGPVSQEMLDQVYADVAAADAVAGHIR